MLLVDTTLFVLAILWEWLIEDGVQERSSHRYRADGIRWVPYWYLQLALHSKSVGPCASPSLRFNMHTCSVRRWVLIQLRSARHFINLIYELLDVRSRPFWEEITRTWLLISLLQITIPSSRDWGSASNSTTINNPTETKQMDVTRQVHSSLLFYFVLRLKHLVSISVI